MMSNLARLGVFLLLVPAAGFAQTSIRFGVLELFHPRVLELTWTGPDALVLYAAGDPIVLNGERGNRRVVLRAEDGRVLFAGHPAARIAASARGGGSAAFGLTVPAKFHREYEGQLEITARGNELIAVVRMEIESAVATIVASEMPRGAPLEALKAQAVATRSYLSAGPRHHDYDFCDTTHCQYLRSPTEVTRAVWNAVRSTQGLVLNWRERPIAALYSSHCGGDTRSLRQAGIDPGNDYPYYSVECRWCRAHPKQQLARNISPNRKWPAQSDSDSDGARTSAGNDRAVLGHGIGMCQYGAVGMALAGADFRSILTHYYPNAELGMIR